MTVSAHNSPSPSGKKRRSLPGRIVRFFALSGLAFLLLGIALVLFTETAYFRSLARDAIIDAADSALTAHLSIGSLEGNVFSGWDLRDVALTASSGPILRVRSIVVRYDIVSLLWKRIDIRELRINAPEIRVTRGGTGKWNLENLVRDTTTTPPSGKPFDWRIIVRNLRIVDGRMLVWDSTTQQQATRDRFDSRHLDIRDLRLALSADIAPGSRALSITELACRNAAGPVSLMSFTADIKSSRSRTAIDLLSIRTQNSGLLLSGSFEGADALSDTAFARFADRTMSLDATALSLDTRDLKYFLPSLDFLGGDPSFSLRVAGNLHALEIASLGLQVEGSQLTFRGKLLDIDKGADMVIDVESDNTVIVASDIPKIVPGLALPDYSSIGTATFRTLRFKGKPLDFETEIDLTTDAGAVQGSAVMDMTGDDIVYDYRLSSRGLDLAKLFQQPLLSSSLNVRLDLRGRNFTPGRAVADGTIFIDSSRYQRYEADSISAVLRVRPDSLRLDLRAALGKSRISADAGLAFLGDSVTGFSLRARARALDLAKALNRDDLESDLTFDVDASGNGFSLAHSSADLRLALARSRFGNREFVSDTLTLHLDQRDRARRELLVETQYFDASVTGLFDIQRFVRDMAVQADSLGEGLRRFGAADDSGIASVVVQPRARLIAPAQPRTTRRARNASAPDTASYMNAAYRLRIKQTESLTRYLGGDVLILLGSLDGTIRGGPAGFAIDGNARITDAYYVDSVRAIIAAGLRLDYSFQRIQPQRAVDEIVMDLRFAAQDIEYNGLHLANIGVRASSRDGVPRVRVQGMLDSTLQLVIDGFARKQTRSWAVSFPVMEVEYLGQRWTNPDTVRVLVTDSAATIASMRLSRHGTVLAVEGTRGFAGANDFKLSLEGLPLSELDSVLSRYDVAIEDHRFSGTASLAVELHGTDAAPRAALELFVRDLGYRQMIFEELQFEARYEPDMLELYSSLRPYPVEGKRKTVFFASGSVPLHLAFGVDSAVQVLGEANLRLKMTDFPVALVEKFVRVFSPLTGDANADLTVQGTIDKFRYSGFLTVTNARGRFVLNNMYYDLGLKVEPKGNAIIIRECTVRNDPRDWDAGLMTAKGEIAMAGFRIREFTLEVDGKLKVLRPESRAAIKSLYGDLFVMTSENSIRYHADEKKAELTGSLKVKEGNLTYASENQGAASKQHANIRYLDVNDIAREKKTSLSMTAKAGQATLKGRALDAETRDSLSRSERSIFDALSYDISISTDGALRIVMPLSTNTQEELNARLNINELKIANFFGVGTFSGEVTLGPDSHYDMLGQRFLASGSLEFIGDPQNPELKLRAIYSDYHTDRVSGQRRQVFVIVTIRGTRTHPKLTWDLRLDSPDGPTTGTDVQSDALSFVIFGLFTDEVSSGGGGSSIVNKAEAALGAMSSKILSGTMSDMIAKAGLRGVLQRIELGNLGTQDARVKVTSEIGRFLIMYDGKINNLASSDISFEIPLSAVFPNIGLGSMVIQASRKTSNSTLESSAASQETSILELKLLYRFSF